MRGGGPKQKKSTPVLTSILVRDMAHRLISSCFLVLDSGGRIYEESYPTWRDWMEVPNKL